MGVGHLNRDWHEPGYRGRLDPAVATLPERLEQAGYRSYMVGKWHLEHNPERGSPKPRPGWPLRRGFESFYGTLRGSGSYYRPPSLLAGDRPAEADGDYYYTNALAAAAVAQIERHCQSGTDQPFFLYVSFTAPHWPLHAPEHDVRRFAGRYDRGWDVLRRARFERQKRLGLTAPGWRLSPRPSDIPAWEATRNPGWESRRMETYAAMVHLMDRGVGSIRAALERHDRLDETLFLFLSDNGASGEELAGYRRLGRWLTPVPEGTRYGDLPDLLPGPPDTFQTVGPAWANLSNTPFRGYKRQTLEGGIASPLVVHWPGRVAAGRIARAPSHVIDLVPTLLDLAQLEPDPELPGRSLLPLLREPAAEAEGDPPSFFWQHEGNRAVLRGRFKLVSSWPGGWRLYDLATDRSELVDLSRRHRLLVREMAQLHRRWRGESSVATWPLPVPFVRELLVLLVAALLVTPLVVTRRLARRLRGARPPRS